MQAELSGGVDIWERVPEGERGVVLFTFLMSQRWSRPFLSPWMCQ
jgi:hypothetical protein